MAAPSIIVFGPTGNVASIAAKTAQKLGAKVFLAMRDPSKSIPGLSTTEESEGGFERVEADLTRTDTVLAAVSKTGAKRAFIYAAHGPSDHMKGTLSALKSGGVEFVVFLSSFSIADRDLESIPPMEIIPYSHARVEMSLLEVFGKENFVALRAGGFATNVALWGGVGIKKGELELWCPGAKFDCITCEDMGEVAGVILVEGLKKEEGGHAEQQHVVYLFGPQFLSQEEQVRTVGKALGKEIKITEIGEEQAVEAYRAKGLPEILAKHLTSMMAETGEGFATTNRELWEQGVANIEKYTGRKATTFEPWVKANLHRFQ